MESGESLVFPVALYVPATVHVEGREWFRRPELHVTTFTPDDLADALEVDLAVLRAAGDAERDELTRSREVRFDGRVARVEAPDGRRTLVAFCDVDGLAGVYLRLSEAVGRPLAVPPTHVTLYTSAPGMKGIGVSTAAQVDACTTPLRGADAAALLRHLPPRTG